MTTKMSLNVNEETRDFLVKARDEEGRTITEIIRRAVSIYKFFVEAKASGKTILIEHEDGSQQKVTFL